MKKRNYAIILLISVAALSGCGGQAAESTAALPAETIQQAEVAGTVDTISVDEAEWEGILQEDLQDSTDPSLQETENAPVLDLNSEELDLSGVSSTIAYSEVFTMNLYPDDFIGKKVRIKGSFTTYQTEEEAKDYFVCLVADSTACCVQGLEFVPEKGFSDPSEYPEEGSTILVEGIFTTYERDGVVYSTLSDARFV